MATTTQGTSPLMIAAQEGHVPVVKALLEHKAEVNLKDNNGLTALSIAACHGNVEAATVLSENGAERSGSSLAEEAFFGDTSKVVEMIKQGNLVDQGVDEESWTPLILAAQNGKTETVSALLEHGADVNYKGVGTTALVEASKQGHIEVIRVLLKNGADLSADTFEEQITALEAAAANGFFDVVEAIIASGADVNQECWKNNRNRTALISAAAGGYTEVVQLLIKHGADVMPHDGDIKDAFDHASKNGHKKLASLIAEHIAPADLNDKLVMSVYMKSMDTFNNILENPACNVDHIGQSNVDELRDEIVAGYSALIMAAGRKETVCLQALLNKQADVNVMGANGQTAAEVAFSQSNLEGLEILLKHGAVVSKEILDTVDEQEDGLEMLDLIKKYQSGQQ